MWRGVVLQAAAAIDQRAHFTGKRAKLLAMPKRFASLLASLAVAEARGRRAATGPAAGKQQFNVYLPPALIRRAKHAAIDNAMSLSRMVEVSLVDHLDRLEREEQEE
jgi:hypothetical protein